MIGTLAKRMFGSANDRFSNPEHDGRCDQRARARARGAVAMTSCGRGPPSSAAARATATTLDDLLVDAFATVREAAKRTLGQRHFDVQLMGGMVLHRGMIAEMKTGEGKTLVATLPVYLNALDRQGRARRHRQRLSGPARRRMDGPDLPLPRPDGRLHRATA